MDRVGIGSRHIARDAGQIREPAFWSRLRSSLLELLHQMARLLGALVGSKLADRLPGQIRNVWNQKFKRRSSANGHCALHNSRHGVARRELSPERMRVNRRILESVGQG